VPRQRTRPNRVFDLLSNGYGFAAAIPQAARTEAQHDKIVSLVDDFVTSGLVA